MEAKTNTKQETIADTYARAVLKKYDGLPQKGKPTGKEWTVLAGLVLVRNGGETPPEAICIATGNRCVGKSRQGGSWEARHATHGCTR